MPEDNRNSKLKIIGIGISVVFLFLLILIITRPKPASNPAQADEKPVYEQISSVQEEADSQAEPVPEEPVSEGFDVPEYTGEAYLVLNEDVPLFTDEDFSSMKGVVYSEQDELGRCGPAYGLIGKETIPEESRGTIGNVKPTGWQTVRYDDLIEDRYLYNRCHLIGYQLAGANAEERNLITGTRYLNVTGMLPIENKIWEYVTGTGNHVLYRVTPVFDEDNLVASGVVIEASSVEDRGKSIQLCRFLFNVQPGIVIDYKTGESYEENTYSLDELESEIDIIDDESDLKTVSRQMPVPEDTAEATYVLNISTMRFHDPSCPSVEDMKEKNRRYSYETREELIEQGYRPCGSCNP